MGRPLVKNLEVGRIRETTKVTTPKARALKICDVKTALRGRPNYLVLQRLRARSASVLRGRRRGASSEDGAPAPPLAVSRRPKPAVARLVLDTSAARREPARANVRALGRRFRETDQFAGSRKATLRPLSVSPARAGTSACNTARGRVVGQGDGHDVLSPPSPPRDARDGVLRARLGGQLEIRARTWSRASTDGGSGGRCAAAPDSVSGLRPARGGEPRLRSRARRTWWSSRVSRARKMADTVARLAPRTTR